MQTKPLTYGLYNDPVLVGDCPECGKKYVLHWQVIQGKFTSNSGYCAHYKSVCLRNGNLMINWANKGE